MSVYIYIYVYTHKRIRLLRQLYTIVHTFNTNRNDVIIYLYILLI